MMETIAYFMQRYRYEPPHQIDGSVQDCSSFIANALELLQFCT